MVPTYDPNHIRNGNVHLIGVFARDIARAVNIRAGKDTSFILDLPPMPRDGEDTFTAGWLASIGVVPRCPVPTIVDHRMCASTNEGFDSHTHRRSTVTWRGYAAEDMATPGWWQTTAETLPPDDWRRCWWCGARPEMARSAVTGALICGTCVTGLVGSRCGVTMRAG